MSFNSPVPALRGFENAAVLEVGGDAEAGVAGGAVGGVRGPGGDPVAVAVGVVAEVGATADRFAEDDAAGVAEVALTPFPDVAAGVVEAVAVGREGVDRRGAEIAVGAGVAVREEALPDVHPVLAPRLQLVAPG